MNSRGLIAKRMETKRELIIKVIQTGETVEEVTDEIISIFAEEVADMQEEVEDHARGEH